MLTNTVSAREIMRGYKGIFNQVNKTGQPVMVISNNKPLGVIISVKQYEDGQNMIKVDVAGTAATLRKLRGSIKDLPSNLSQNHDAVLWDR